MVLSKLKNVPKIYLITEKSYVVNFFMRLGYSSDDILVRPILPDIPLPIDYFVIIDASILEEGILGFNKNSTKSDTVKYESILGQIKNRTYPVLCLVDKGLSEKVRNFVRKLFRFIIPFPFQAILLSGYFKNMKEQRCKGCLKSCVEGRYLSGNIEDYSVEEIYKSEVPVEDSLYGCFQGSSKCITLLRDKLKTIGQSDSIVLLLGETGTGKTTGASIIHQLSKRSGRKMYSLNISTIDSSIACSSLFGTTAGAYTDAIDKKGFFALANKSTLFLDEIGVASTSVQTMLLTVIETGTFHKLGSEFSEQTDVRLIFATNSNPEEMLKLGGLRQDFFYRISGNIILFPTLRNRKEDIPYIVESYISSKKRTISKGAINKLMDYNWPGNIRELQQCIDRALLFSKKKTILADDIDFGLKIS